MAKYRVIHRVVTIEEYNIEAETEELAIEGEGDEELVRDTVTEDEVVSVTLLAADE